MLVLDIISKLEDRLVYHDYEQMKDEMRNIHRTWPRLTRIYGLSKTSVEGRKLLVIQISENVRREREILKPMIKLVGNIHGNEVAGREILLFLAKYLLMMYDAGDKYIKTLIKDVDIHILPSLNPDGFKLSSDLKCMGKCSKFDPCHLAGRYNVNGVDLNRDFPTYENITDSKSRQELYLNRQPETQAMMKWIVQQPFVLSIGFHSGALVVSYPYDSPTSRRLF